MTLSFKLWPAWSQNGHQPAADEPHEVRRTCGSLLARRAERGIEIKCRRCRPVVYSTISNRRRRSPTAPPSFAALRADYVFEPDDSSEERRYRCLQVNCRTELHERGPSFGALALLSG